MNLSNLLPGTKPANYAKIDEYVSRSAQPTKSGFRWLKKHGVTDVINFRRGDVCNEKNIVESLGMHYHNIPTSANHPSVQKVDEFINVTNNIISDGGKVHIHCQAGADRTSLYSSAYKAFHGFLGQANLCEWVERGHNFDGYSDLYPWAMNTFRDKGWIA